MQPGVSLFGWLPGERRVSELGAGVGLHSLCVFLSQKIMRALHLKKTHEYSIYIRFFNGI